MSGAVIDRLGQELDLSSYSELLKICDALREIAIPANFLYLIRISLLTVAEN